MAATHNLQHIDVDAIWTSLGPWGIYQWKQLSSYLFICVSWVIHQLSIVFIGYRPKIKCTASNTSYGVTANSSIATWKEYGECTVNTYVNTSSGDVSMTSETCNSGWDYDIPREQSFVSEWDFVCSNSELAELTQSLLIVGMMVGTFLFPSLADRYGRKPVMVGSHVLMFAIVMGTAFSPNYAVFVVLRVLTGAVSMGALSGTTLALESFPKEVRHNTEPLALAMWTTAICVMSPIAYALRNVSWRYLQITYALMSAWSVFQWWMLDESLRWVIANGQVKRAREIIKKACRWNKKDYNKVIEAAGLSENVLDNLAISLNHQEQNTNDINVGNIENDVSDHVTKNGHESNSKNGITFDVINSRTSVVTGTEKRGNDGTDTGVKKYSVLDIIRHKQIRQVSFIIWFTWCVDSLAYYGLYMISADLYGDRYINFLLSGLIEYPASVFEFFALGRIGRKWTCIICHIIAAVGLILATVLTYTADGNTKMLTAGTALTLVGKMGITGAFSSAYVVTPELYPTNMRNSGLGVGSFMGKVGAMIAPFSRNVSHTTRWLPGAVYGVLCVAVVFMFAFVPETNGVELPQTIEELTHWYQVNKFDLGFGKNRHTDARQTGGATEASDEENKPV